MCSLTVCTERDMYYAYTRSRVATGDRHPLKADMEVDVAELQTVLEMVETERKVCAAVAELRRNGS